VTPLLRVAYAVTEAILGTPVAVPALLSAGAAGGDPVMLESVVSCNELEVLVLRGFSDCLLDRW